MKTETKPAENLAECGNKSKPLLAEVISAKYIRVFKLYKKALSDLKMYEILRGGSFGIANRNIDSQDYYAKEWQSIRMRVEILESFLEGRNPNWFHSYWLSIVEMSRRNDSYNLR